MRDFASLKATTMLSYTCFGYWEHFYILEKLGLSLTELPMHHTSTLFLYISDSPLQGRELEFILPF